MEGGSVGFQIGGSETDVIMLVLNKVGADKLFSSKFTLGADASVAAGPVGRESSADTDAKFRAEILTYSRSRGVFAGPLPREPHSAPRQRCRRGTLRRRQREQNDRNGRHPTPRLGRPLDGPN